MSAKNGQDGVPIASDAAWSSIGSPRPSRPLLEIDDVIAAASGVIQRPPGLGGNGGGPSAPPTVARVERAPVETARVESGPVERPVVERPPVEGPVVERPPAASAPALEETTGPAPAPTVQRPRIDRLAAMRDVTRKLRASPSSEETLQFVIDTACECTGAEAGMLTVSTTHGIQQVVHGTALGAGPYISVALRVGGPTFGELVLTRMSGAPEFDSEDETFADLVAEYVAKAVSGLRAGTVLSQDEQDFVDRIVQELHTPLANAVNLLGLVLGDEGGELSEPKQRYASSVFEDAERMLGLVNDLTVLSHLRPPELRELQKIGVAPWLRGGVERFRARAEARGIELDFAEPEETLIVQGIPEQLDVVIDHLLSNAVKFSEEGGRIDVTATIHESMLRVVVADQGIGFDGADAPRMVERYTRAINAEAARIPGTGLGLYLVKEIVNNHQGRIWLESSRDEGTQAYVAFPLGA